MRVDLVFTITKHLHRWCYKTFTKVAHLWQTYRLSLPKKGNKVKRRSTCIVGVVDCRAGLQQRLYSVELSFQTGPAQSCQAFLVCCTDTRSCNSIELNLYRMMDSRVRISVISKTYRYNQQSSVYKWIFSRTVRSEILHTDYLHVDVSLQIYLFQLFYSFIPISKHFLVSFLVIEINMYLVLGVSPWPLCDLRRLRPSALFVHSCHAAQCQRFDTTGNLRSPSGLPIINSNTHIRTNDISYTYLIAFLIFWLFTKLTKL